MYSYSFEQNPEWTEQYARQEEIYDYLLRVAQKWNLFKYVRFNTSVEEARWDDVEGKWNVAVKISGTKDSEFGLDYTIKTNYLVSAVGQLNVPQYPDIPGFDLCKSKVMHSARWDWSYSLKGKTVGIVGNGATAAQIIPEIAKNCKNLTVFQRTANWVRPRGNTAVPAWQRKLFRYAPFVLSRYRAQLMDIRESVHFKAVTTANSAGNDNLRQLSADMLMRQIPEEPELREKLTPKYSPGCKRIIVSDEFFPALNRPNVQLETRSIVSFTKSGIAVDGEEYEFDLIILATGFKTLDFMHPIKVYGKDERPLDDVWHTGAHAFLGMTVDDMPNFAMMYGPNTNLGHNSIILMIESQSRYIATMTSAVLAAHKMSRTLAITPKPQATAIYNQALQSTLSKSTFSDPGCNSWYKNANNLITNNWGSTATQYQNLLSEIIWDDYNLEGTYAQEIKACKKRRVGKVQEGTVLSNATAIGSALTVMTLLVAFVLAPAKKKQAVWTSLYNNLAYRVVRERLIGRDRK